MLGPYEFDTLHLGDCVDLGEAVPEQSVDLIFCDPPYIEEHMWLYGWLGCFAARVLKPNGFLCAMAGVYWKNEVMELLGQNMDYWWDMVLQHQGQSPVMWHKRVISRYKSLLVYSLQGEEPRPRHMTMSWFTGAGRDKRYHTWGQDEATTRYYIDAFSRQGDLVIDPFVGGGTVPYVCRQLLRRFVGFDRDAQALRVAEKRLSEVQIPMFEPELVQVSMEV